MVCCVGRKTLVLLAAMFWSLIGLYLLRRGWVLLHGSDYLVIGVALVVGTFKSIMVFQRTALTNVERINKLGEQAPVAQVFSGKAWGLIAFMMALGMIMRFSGLPTELRGFVIIAVGWGLLLASRVVWSEWQRL